MSAPGSTTGGPSSSSLGLSPMLLSLGTLLPVVPMTHLPGRLLFWGVREGPPPPPPTHGPIDKRCVIWIIPTGPTLDLPRTATSSRNRVGHNFLHVKLKPRHSAGSGTPVSILLVDCWHSSGMPHRPLDSRVPNAHTNALRMALRRAGTARAVRPHADTRTHAGNVKD